jgi:hypothetical protein
MRDLVLNVAVAGDGGGIQLRNALLNAGRAESASSPFVRSSNLEVNKKDSELNCLKSKIARIQTTISYIVLLLVREEVPLPDLAGD